MGTPNIRILDDEGAAAEAAAQEIARIIGTALSTHPRCAIALAGGRTPRKLHERLANPDFRHRIDWSRLAIYWGDERCVPPRHPDSNYRMARETLLDHVPVDERAVYRIRGEIDPGRAAREYEAVLKESFEAPLPRFDILLLGIGEDGHTASLFPGRPEVNELERLTTPVESPKPPRHRVSLTLAAINAARCALFLVTGGHKAETVARILQPSVLPEDLPAARVRPAKGRVVWFLDAAAARALGGD